jgi:hypothetical protein
MTHMPEDQQRDQLRREADLRAALPGKTGAELARGLAAKGWTLDDLRRLAAQEQSDIAAADTALFDAIKAFRESGGESDGSD